MRNNQTMATVTLQIKMYHSTTDRTIIVHRISKNGYTYFCNNLQM